MTTGTYSERLKCGGELQVQQNGWKIHYYFQGPDLRYSGTLFDISSTSIDDYIKAWTENWNEYMNLKKSIPASGTFSKTGAQNMSINIGGYRDGVCLTSYHMRITSADELQCIVQCYQYAKKRAVEVQAFLRTI